MKTKIAVLVSGGGTNLQALLDAQKSGVLCSGEIALVVSNNAGAFALERAKNAGVPTAVLLKKELGGHTPERLQRRVMEQAEWILLPRAAEQVCAQIQNSEE